MTVKDDRTADRRMGISVGGLIVAEVVLAGLADAGVISLAAWLVLTVVAVLIVATFAAWLQRFPTR